MPSKLTEQINAAPEPLKSYIHDLVSGYGKSAEMVQDNIMLKDSLAGLALRNEGQRGDIIRGLERRAEIASRLLHDAETEEDRIRYCARKYAFIEIANALRRGWSENP